jgi:hypothetical protein
MGWRAQGEAHLLVGAEQATAPGGGSKPPQPTSTGRDYGPCLKFPKEEAMFRTANYKLLWTEKGPRVVINLGDGFPETCSETQLVNVLKDIRAKRGRYKQETEFTAVLKVYQGALSYLRQQIEVERRR